VNGVFGSSLSFFLTWWGAFLMGALDSSMLVFLPFGIDTLVIYLAARNEGLFWLYPVLATAGSLAGATLTFWIGRKVGAAGLERLVPKRRLERIRNRVKGGGAVALAVPALLPPPFPLTPFILACGALDVDRRRFFVTFGTVRIARFGLERVVSGRRLERLRCRVKDSGAVAMAVPALLPPPFPLTPFILTCGALNVDRRRFFVTFGTVRMVRFGLEGLLARLYGRGILRVLQSDAFQTVIIVFVVVAVTGTVVSAVLLWRSTRDSRLRTA